MRVPGLILLVWLIACACVHAQPLDVDAFADDPHFAYPTLSPDGRRLAYITYQHGHRLLAVMDIETGDSRAARIDNIRSHGLLWPNNRHVIIWASDIHEIWGRRNDVDISALVSIDTQDDMAGRQLLRRSTRLGSNLDTSRVIGRIPATGELLVPVYDRRHRYSLFRVDPAGGSLAQHELGSPTTIDWVADEQGQAIARLEFDGLRERHTLHVRRDGRWHEILELSDVARPRYGLQGLLPDGRLAVATQFVPGDPERDSMRALYELSMDTGEIVDVVFQRRDYDLENVIIDPYTNRVVGVTWIDDYERTHWFDADLAQHQSNIDGALPSENPRIISWSQNRERFLIATESAGVPPAFFLYDVRGSRIELLGASYPRLSTGNLQTRERVTYTARDGATIEAYLVTPDGDGPFPAVVLPHGGPESRDRGGFDVFAHFLADRGYAVIQPNFRGSSGYGYRWMTAGYGNWGTGVMQDDVTDAARFLVRAGLAAPGRICIAGASYGGYAALAGAVFTPDLYRCAVSISGVSDINRMLRYARNRFGHRHWMVDAWEERFGNGSERLRQAANNASPARHADAVRIPVLLIHGRNDTVVPHEQSEVMQSALRRAGKPVEAVWIDEGDHWLTSSGTRRTVLLELEAFLDAHIGD